MSKSLTLEELAAGATASQQQTEPVEQPILRTESIKSAKEVSINEIKNTLHVEEKTEEEEIKDPEYIANAVDSMLNTLQKKKDFIENEMMPIVEENAREIAMENELEQMENNESISDDLDNVEEELIDKNTTDNAVEDDSVSKDIADLDELLKDFEDEDDNELVVDDINSEETVEETRERFKESLSDIRVTSKVIDLSNVKIRQNAVAVSAVLDDVSRSKNVKAIDWALYHSKKSIRVTECSGLELDALKKTMANSNDINRVIESLKIVYNHIVDANKPSFEAWTKLIRTEDIESLYYALYKACYNDVNVIGRTCEANGCEKTSIINTDITKMVKFDSDDVKKEFYSILSGDTTTNNTIIESEIIAISDDLAISYSQPTLYTTFIQYSTLNQDVTRKYADILNTMAYITGFYKIETSEDGQVELVPIQVKSYPNNLAKTVLSKIKVYKSILGCLTNDQYNVLTGKLNNIITDSKVSYVFPEDTCPECGAKLPEEDIDSMLNLLFTRAQLAQIKSL